jgi:hypothetical protein
MILIVVIAVKCGKKDDHILRSKLSYGDCIGMAFKCPFDGRYDFSPNFFAGGNVGLLIVDASGAQKQLLYNDTPEDLAGPKGSVDMKVVSVFGGSLSRPCFLKTGRNAVPVYPGCPSMAWRACDNSVREKGFEMLAVNP